MQLQQRIFKTIFFGNYFYGICAVALSIEASLQQGVALNTWAYYLVVCCLTILYYTKAYVTETAYATNNPRSLWYIANQKFVGYSQVLFSILAIGGLLFLWGKDVGILQRVSLTDWCILLIFPLVATLYYGSASIVGNYNLRATGWLKPFVIGFVWAGLVTIYPILYHSIAAHHPYSINIIALVLFEKNFMFISVLCILFDIKDYAADHNQQLKTFVVRYGLRKTIFYIVIPLCVVGLGTFLITAYLRQFSIFKMLINTLPFLLLIIVAYSLHRRKTIVYYLAIIDGLMLVKAVCGTIAMIYF